MNLDSLTIKEAREIATLFSPRTPSELSEAPTVRIAVLQRGWVVVGRYSRTGEQVTIENAAVVRLWGTTRGLGQLAKEGPQTNTNLDDCPTVRVHALAVVLTMDCDQEKWSCRR